MSAFISAREGASARQRHFFCGLTSLVLGLGMVSFGPLALTALVLSPFFLMHVLFILGAALEKPVPPDERAVPSHQDIWPRYTVLVPLYREASVAAQLVQTLRELDYPPERLQILLLLEAGDHATRDALMAARLEAHFEVLIVPPGRVRTKPNALNHGLAVATGEFVTVYDAEDLPDPDQLRRAVATFAGLPRSTACLQARLVIDNAPDGWLPLMMSIEYAGLFDATKCGLAAMALPVALGGTSNHFRRDVLVELGGWDAWNVTEDAELGLRLGREGYKVADLPSVTQEEAPISLRAWFDQRRRWHKGFLQTLVTHTRRPWQTIRRMGLFDWSGGLVQIAGTVVGALLFPFLSLHVMSAAMHGTLFDNHHWSVALLNATALWVACCGLMTATVPVIIGLNRRRIWQFAPWLVTLPLYLILISAAAWVALFDYWREPFRWLKTEHGLGKRRKQAFRSRRAERP